MRYYHGYTVVVASFFLRFATLGTFSSLGLYITPLGVSFGGIGTGLAAALPGVIGSVSFLSALLVGALQDYIAARAGRLPIWSTFTAGGLCFGIGTIGGSYCQSFPWLIFFSVFTGIGIGWAGWSASGLCVLWFQKRKGTAMSLALTGGGIGGVVYALLIQKLLVWFSKSDDDEPCHRDTMDPGSCEGWRETMRYTGLFSAILIVASSLPMRKPKAGEVDDYESGDFGMPEDEQEEESSHHHHHQHHPVAACVNTISKLEGVSSMPVHFVHETRKTPDLHEDKPLTKDEQDGAILEEVSDCDPSDEPSEEGSMGSISLAEATQRIPVSPGPASPTKKKATVCFHESCPVSLTTSQPTPVRSLFHNSLTSLSGRQKASPGGGSSAAADTKLSAAAQFQKTIAHFHESHKSMTEYESRVLEDVMNKTVEEANHPAVADHIVGATTDAQIPKLTLRQLLGTRTLFLLCFWAFIITVAYDTVFMFIPASAESAGLPNEDGALALALTGIFLLVGTFTLGFVADALGHTRTFQLTMTCCMLVVVVWPFCQSRWSLLLITSCYGFFAAGLPLCHAVLSVTYGPISPDYVLTMIGMIHAMFAPGTLYGMWLPSFWHCSTMCCCVQLSNSPLFR